MTQPVPSLSFTANWTGKPRALVTPVTVMPAFDPAQTTTHPPGKKYNAIWDTGATNTMITQQVVDDLGLMAHAIIRVKHAGGESEREAFFANVALPNKVGIPNLKLSTGILIGAEDVLIGMDIINAGDFAITHKDGNTAFSFRMPSLDHIDYVKQVKTLQSKRVGRNEPCPYGSGKKYKKCHGKIQ